MGVLVQGSANGQVLVQRERKMPGFSSGEGEGSCFRSRENEG